MRMGRFSTEESLLRMFNFYKEWGKCFNSITEELHEKC